MADSHPIQKRLIVTSLAIREEGGDSPVFQHAIFCQTCLPYREQEEDVRQWKRSNGNSHLIVSAGEIYDPKTGRLEPVGLPFGPKARLITTFIDTEAVRTQSPIVCVDRSLAAFMRRMNLCKNGRNSAAVREQMRRLNACRMHVILNSDDRVVQQDRKLIKNFSFWVKNEEYYSGNGSRVELDEGYFEQLVRHAVPLDERAICALSHNPMALDIYRWLAHRLHRVKGRQFIPWTSLKDQFGFGHNGAMSQFRRPFLKNIDIVKSQYPNARFDADGRGMSLYNSPPPISKTMYLIDK